MDTQRVPLRHRSLDVLEPDMCYSLMNVSFLTNALLRVDGLVSEEPKLPFERPAPNKNLLVLEFSQLQTTETAFTEIQTQLNLHAEEIRKFQQGGAEVSLFLEFRNSLGPLVIEAAFLKILADMGIGLEVYSEPG